MDHRPAPPTLWVRTPRGTTEFRQDRVVVGRELSCDVVLADPRTSRVHLTVERAGAGWHVVDSSSGGTFLYGALITRQAITATPTTLRLGDLDGEEVSLWHSTPAAAAAPAPAPVPPPYVALPPPQPPPPVVRRPEPPTPGPWSVPVPPPPVAQPVVPPGQLAHGRTMFPGGLVPGRAVTFGRDLSNDVVLDDPLVSRFHGHLQVGVPSVIHDRGSFNGIFVNGVRVEGSAQLAPGVEVIIGNQTFRWSGAELVTTATTHEFTLYADGLSVVVQGGRRLLDNLSFQLDPSSLTAVIGPSGAGKSTLLGALTGLRPATHGRVTWQGHDLYANYDQLRFQIGLVPQQDIGHPQLKVSQALGYAARLRLPPDTTKPERDARVAHVAHQLQLTQRLDNRIGTQLSGGQRKRVSIATELLTAPPLLFLDEPTSGLDPGLDLEVMRQLRSLADDGRVVMVVTHSVLALDVCDNVMVLAPGGRIAYFGPPSGVLAHFGAASYPQVFDLLDVPDLWQRIAPPAPSVDAGRVRPVAAVPAPPRQSLGTQLSTLVRRNAAVMVADRLLLGMLLLLPLVLGALSRIVPGHDGLSLDRIGVVGQAIPAEEAKQRLIVLIVAACLMGTAIAIRELVGERPIFRREYAVGLSPRVYFASKVVVLGLAAFVQGLVVTWIATAGLPGADGDAGTLRVAVAIGALTFTMAVVGLCLSAVVGSTEQTMPALVGTIMVQLVLSGALFPVARRPGLEQLAWLSPSRWGYAAAGSAMGLDRSNKPAETDWIVRASARHYGLDLLVLGLLCALAVLAGLWLTRRSAKD